MPKYLLQTSLTQEEVKGTMKEGGTARKLAVTKGLEAKGGKVEAYYYAFGKTDLYTIVDMPDNVHAAAVSLVGNAPDASNITYTVLLTPEEIDQAIQLAQKMSASYRAPGR